MLMGVAPPVGLPPEVKKHGRDQVRHQQNEQKIKRQTPLQAAEHLSNSPEIVLTLRIPCLESSLQAIRSVQ
jgi:hypothetical protein